MRSSPGRNSRWSRRRKSGLVFLLASHLTGGLRLLAIEFVGWRGEAQKAMLAVAGGVAAFCALLFALNLV